MPALFLECEHMTTLIQSTVEPISLEMARLQCSIDPEGSPPTSPWDSLLEVYIAQAREWCENYTGQTFAQKTIEYAIDEFPQMTSTTNTVTGIVTTTPGELELIGGPIVGLPEIRYVDQYGIEQVFDPSLYTVHTSLAGESTLRLVTGATWGSPAVDVSWPTDAVGGLTVRYTVGYSVPGESPDNNPIPPAVKGAILLLVGHWFKNREETVDATSQRQVASIPMGARALLDTYRIRRGFA